MTLTVRLAVAVKLPPSVTVRVTMFAPVTALQLAVMVALIVPLALVIAVTDKPAGTPVAVTVKALAAVKSSPTVAIVAVVPALPCCRVTGAATVMVGAALTLSVKFALVVAPQLSVAVTVSVCKPEGAAFVTVTTPVTALTASVPVKPAEAVTVKLEIVPLSAGATVGVIVVEPPGFIGPALA